MHFFPPRPHFSSKKTIRRKASSFLSYDNAKHRCVSIPMQILCFLNPISLFCIRFMGVDFGCYTMVITIELFNIQIYTFFLFETNIVSLDKISCASEEEK